MPARMARYFLRITARHGNADITEEAAKREEYDRLPPSRGITSTIARNYIFTKEELVDGYPHCSNAIASFQTLMERLEDRGIWEKNPFVGVYNFEFTTELTAAERRHYNLPKQ